MQFQRNTDEHFQDDVCLSKVAATLMASFPGHHASMLIRTEVCLSDANGIKGGPDDISCMIAARPDGMKLQTVTHSVANVDIVLRGGTKKMRAFPENVFGTLFIC